MKIKPYGSSSLKCKGVHMGPVICGDAVAKLKIYVVNRDVETLLSGPAPIDCDINVNFINKISQNELETKEIVKK